MTDKTQADRNAAAARVVGLEISQSIIEIDVCHIAMTGPPFDGLPRIECPSRVFDPITHAADFAELLERVYAKGYHVGFGEYFVDVPTEGGGCHRYRNGNCCVTLPPHRDGEGTVRCWYGDGPTIRHALVDAVVALGDEP